MEMQQCIGLLSSLLKTKSDSSNQITLSCHALGLLSDKLIACFHQSFKSLAQGFFLGMYITILSSSIFQTVLPKVKKIGALDYEFLASRLRHNLGAYASLVLVNWTLDRAI